MMIHYGGGECVMEYVWNMISTYGAAPNVCVIKLISTFGAARK